MKIALVLAYLLLGYVLYRIRFPEGVFPQKRDPERERIRRTGRRRVLPVPDPEHENAPPERVPEDDEDEA